jgi:hypothetical protein
MSTKGFLKVLSFVPQPPPLIFPSPILWYRTCSPWWPPGTTIPYQVTRWYFSTGISTGFAPLPREMRDRVVVGFNHFEWPL